MKAEACTSTLVLLSKDWPDQFVIDECHEANRLPYAATAPASSCIHAVAINLSQNFSRSPLRLFSNSLLIMAQLNITHEPIEMEFHSPPLFVPYQDFLKQS